MRRPPTHDLALRLFGTKPEHALALMRAAWPAAVGAELARRTEVVAFERGVLRIRVPDGSWRANLFRMRGEIIGRLRKIVGAAAPRSLAFVEGTVAGTTAAPSEPAPEPAPVPASVPLPADLVAAAQSIGDRELRDRFLAVAGRYLTRFADGHR